MLNSSMEFLTTFGWSEFFEAPLPKQFLSNEEPSCSSNSLVPARVICEERNLYRLQAGFENIFWASVSGKMQFKASHRESYPAVGDWVLVELPPQSDRGVIHQVLPRKTMIYRRQVGGADMQILSTNVDYAFITSSLNADLNYRRIERYLAIAHEAQVEPVILLTKADIYEEDLQAVLMEVQREFPTVSVYALSKEDFAASEFLQRYLRPGTTSVFMGSSGVGKSTLVNFLIGEEKIKTQDIREEDGKGRHTTTSRHLYVSRYGGLIIDTPGMRELQLSDHAEGVSSQFSEIEELAGHCRFGNCLHQTEPGCAILSALDSGQLSEEKWRSYQKLEAEVRFGLRKQNKALASEQRKVWKKRSAEARKWSRMKRER